MTVDKEVWKNLQAQVKRIVKDFGKMFLKIPGVTGIATGPKFVDGQKTETIAIVVFVEKKLDEISLHPGNVIPKEFMGIPTDVQEKGPFRAYQGRTERWRPVPPGVSIGHYNITAGTYGFMAYTYEGEKVGISNNHVLANANDANLGDPILQPGVYDGGNNPADKIGELFRFIPIHFLEPSDCGLATGMARFLNKISKSFGRRSRFRTYIETQDQVTNTVDVAMFLPNSEDLIMSQILEIGEPKAVADEIFLEDTVQKSGRSSGVKSGKVTQLNAMIPVAYSRTMVGKQAIFEDQVICEAIGEPGDSGSCVLNDQEEIVGLLFAGSEDSTVFNTIDNVIDALDIIPVTQKVYEPTFLIDEFVKVDQEEMTSEKYAEEKARLNEALMPNTSDFNCF